MDTPPGCNPDGYTPGMQPTWDAPLPRILPPGWIQPQDVTQMDAIAQYGSTPSTPAQDGSTPPQKTDGQQVGDTHPTVMHTCYQSFCHAQKETLN